MTNVQSENKFVQVTRECLIDALKDMIEEVSNDRVSSFDWDFKREVIINSIAYLEKKKRKESNDKD